MVQDFRKDKELMESYTKYDLNLRLERLRVGLILGIIFVGFFVLLDFVLYEEFFSVLVIARLLSVVVLCSLFFVVRLKYLNLVKLVGSIWAIILFLSMDVLIVLTDGVISSYYGGLMLIIVALTVLMPWTVIETIIMCVVMVLLYLITIYLHSYMVGEAMDYVNLINNLFFLVGSGVICSTASYYSSRLRFKEFCLNYEIEEKNDELLKLNQIRTEFFANISHEFRTPLTLILGPVKSIIEDVHNKFSTISRENLNIVKENGFRLLKLVNDLLDVISLEKGQMDLQLKNIDVNSFVRSRVDLMNHMARLKGVKLVKNVSVEDIIIRVDENALDKIIINLINNAIKFTPKDGVIEVSTKAKNNKLIIEIADDGIGIKKRDLGYIFDRFKQVDGSNTRQFQGTGLGLALVKELVEVQGGEISVESVFKQGTTFAVSFEIYKSHGNEKFNYDVKKNDNLSWIQENVYKSFGIASDIDKEIYNKQGFNKIDTEQNIKVLVVDDEPDMLNFIVKTLRVNGYEVLVAMDGKEAIKVANAIKPDIILLDLMLPSIDGLEVCKILKENAELEFIKIILLTAKVDEQSKIQALQNGADDFITKPFCHDELLLRISNLSRVQKLQTILRQDLVVSRDELKEALQKVRDSQAQLIQSEKLNTIGTMSASVIHEVNNPLNHVLSALRFLKIDSLVEKNDDLQEIVDDIEEGMNRINNIVKEFKDFVRLDGVTKMKKDVLAIVDVLNVALKFTAFDCKGIKIVNNIDQNLMVVGSSNHIVQVLINLISNGCRAIERLDGVRKGVIEFGCEFVGDDRVLVMIRDNGVGMDEEEVTKIFESFYTTGDPGKGTGLGLNICSTIVQNHGGSLKVQSKLGEGSEFSFDLERKG